MIRLVLFLITFALSFYSLGAHAAEKPINYIGDMQKTTAEYEDTLLKIMRKYDLGYIEIRSANPDVDVWIPGEGTEIILPTRHLIPDVAREGIVINLAEMRIYSFLEGADQPKTWPIGIGREGLHTPKGETKVVRKKDGPSWRPTPRMRREDPKLPEVVPPGEANPLGTHALYLGWPAYLIHGTNKPFGIGRRVSSGCIRMYPEDIVEVFSHVPVGTKVTVIDQPIKLAWIDNTLYLEAHTGNNEFADEIEQTGTVSEYAVPDSFFEQIHKAVSDEYKDDVDWLIIRNALKERSGYPVPILTVHDKDAAQVEPANEIDVSEEKNDAQPAEEEMEATEVTTENESEDAPEQIEDTSDQWEMDYDSDMLDGEVDLNEDDELIESEDISEGEESETSEETDNKNSEKIRPTKTYILGGRAR